MRAPQIKEIVDTKRAYVKLSQKKKKKNKNTNTHTHNGGIDELLDVCTSNIFIV